MKKEVLKLWDDAGDLSIDIEMVLEILNERKDAIEDKASERESGENTEREQEMISKLEEVIYMLESARDSIDSGRDELQNALDVLDAE